MAIAPEAACRGRHRDDGVAIGGEALPGEAIEKLASLPTREKALAMLLGVLQAPITKFVRTLAEPQAKLVRSLAAVRDQKQAA